MSGKRIEITPETRIGLLLEAYPRLEGLLLELSPAFVALKNPLLRRTVAKVTTLRQAAQTGGVNPITMVNALRAEIRENPLEFSPEPEEEIPFSPSGKQNAPADTPTVKVIDVRPILAEGNHPKEMILEEADALSEGQKLEFITPFPPTPLIEALRERGFRTETSQTGPGEIRNRIYR